MSPTISHHLELNDSHTLGSKQDWKVLSTCSQVVLCFLKITIKRRRMWEWISVGMDARIYGGRNDGSKQGWPSTQQRSAPGVLRRNSDIQTGRAPRDCQGFNTDGFPSFSLVKCGSNAKELVSSLFNTQPNLLLVDAPLSLLADTPFGLYQDLTITFSHSTTWSEAKYITAVPKIYRQRTIA